MVRSNPGIAVQRPLEQDALRPAGMEGWILMLRKSLLAAVAAVALAALVMPASAKTLRYANQGDLKSLDPLSLIHI